MASTNMKVHCLTTSPTSVYNYVAMFAKTLAEYGNLAFKRFRTVFYHFNHFCLKHV